MSTPFHYDFFQQIYCLSAISNVVGNSTGSVRDLEKAFDTALKQGLPVLNGFWKLTWGPAVYKENEKGQDSGPENAWFVAVSDEQKTCTVAIAGSAPKNLNDWLGDLEVYETVDFPLWLSKWTTASVPDPSNYTTEQTFPTDRRELCALGTCKFVSYVQQPVTSWNGVPMGTLGNYLAKFTSQKPDYKIVFTGHSLGGALVPALALGLLRKGIFRTSNVKVMASAGPTPGNRAFANAYNAALPPESLGSDYRIFNMDYYNTLDIVPQGYSVNASDDRNLKRISDNIYDEATADKPTRQIVSALQFTATQDANLGLPDGILDPTQGYRPIQGRSFTGAAISRVTSVQGLIDSVTNQHTKQYWKHLGIETYVNDFATKLYAQPGVEPIKPKPELITPPLRTPKKHHPAHTADEAEAKAATAEH